MKQTNIARGVEDLVIPECLGEGVVADGVRLLCRLTLELLADCWAKTLKAEGSLAEIMHGKEKPKPATEPIRRKPRHRR